MTEIHALCTLAKYRKKSCNDESQKIKNNAKLIIASSGCCVFI